MQVSSDLFFDHSKPKTNEYYRSLVIRLDSDPKCVEALLTQLSARLASGPVNEK